MLSCWFLIPENEREINRHIIDADAEAGLIKKIAILLRIKSETSKIIASKPDLVITISTPATKYSKDAIIAALLTSAA